MTEMTKQEAMEFLIERIIQYSEEEYENVVVKRKVTKKQFIRNKLDNIAFCLTNEMINPSCF